MTPNNFFIEVLKNDSFVGYAEFQEHGDFAEPEDAIVEAKAIADTMLRRREPFQITVRRAREVDEDGAFGPEVWEMSYRWEELFEPTQEELDGASD